MTTESLHSIRLGLHINIENQFFLRLRELASFLSGLAPKSLEPILLITFPIGAGTCGEGALSGIFTGVGAERGHFVAQVLFEGNSAAAN